MSRVISGVDPIFKKYIEDNKKLDAIRRQNQINSNKLYESDIQKYYAARFPDMVASDMLASSKPGIPHVFVNKDAVGDITISLQQFFQRFLDAQSVVKIMNDLSDQEQKVIFYFKKKFETELHSTFNVRDVISYDAFLLFCKRFAKEFGGITQTTASSTTTSSSKPVPPPKPPKPAKTTPVDSISPSTPPIPPKSIINDPIDSQPSFRSQNSNYRTSRAPRRLEISSDISEDSDSEIEIEIPSIIKTNNSGKQTAPHTIAYFKYLAGISAEPFEIFFRNNNNNQYTKIWNSWKNVFFNPDQIGQKNFNITGFREVYTKLRNLLPSTTQLPSTNIPKNYYTGRGIKGQRKKSDPRLAKIILGKGASFEKLKKPRKEKTHNYFEKNGFKVDRDQLENNQLIIKKDNGQHRYGPHFIGDKTKHVIESFLKNETIDNNEYQKLSLADKLPLYFINYFLKINNELPDLRSDLKNQFEILKGSLQAGNDNPKIFQQLKLILALMVETKMITKNTMMSMLHDSII